MVKEPRYSEVESPFSSSNKRRRGRPETAFRLRRSRFNLLRELSGSGVKKGKRLRLPKVRRDTTIKWRNPDELRRISGEAMEKVAADPALRQVYEMSVASSRSTRRKLGLTVDEAAEKAGTSRPTMYWRIRFLYDHRLLGCIPAELHRPKNGAGRPPDVFIAD